MDIAKQLAAQLCADGHSVSLLHGKDMSPQDRDKVWADFRAAKTKVLVATNVIARGVDVLQVRISEIFL